MLIIIIIINCYSLSSSSKLQIHESSENQYCFPTVFEHYTVKYSTSDFIFLLTSGESGYRAI